MYCKEKYVFVSLGFNTREYKFENLEEYWNYSATVTATTSIGSKTSMQTKQYRTLPTGILDVLVNCPVTSFNNTWNNYKLDICLQHKNYRVCLTYGSGVSIGPAIGTLYFKHVLKIKKKSFCLKTMIDIFMQHCLICL